MRSKIKTSSCIVNVKLKENTDDNSKDKLRICYNNSSVIQVRHRTDQRYRESNKCVRIYN
jgi:hypothetical protein